MKRIYYDNEKDCLQHNKYKVNETEINDRYKNFKHTIFTAGDVEQFYRRCGDINEDINNTFLYLFHKFKKGIFIRIKDNKLHTFIPFSKKNFINEWSHLVHVTHKYYRYHSSRYNKYLDGLMNYISTQKKYKHNFWLHDMDLWYSNNCLIRNESPIHEGESGVLEMRDMFVNLCKNRKIKDVYFFVNKRDFPQIKKNRTEPYHHIYGDNTPLLSHHYDTYCSIFSMCSKEGYEDIPIPTWEDWCRISSQHQKFFPRNCRNYNHSFKTNWSDKINKAVFRGSSTGAGIDKYTNMRIKISMMKHSHIDAGITSWNIRPRLNIVDGVVTLDTINNDFKTVEPLTPERQSTYKYIINIDGHSSAFRLSLEMSMGSVILLVDSEYYLWFRKNMKPYVHYVPVKKDLSDIEKVLEWCLSHDDECKKIAENSLEFYNTYLLEENIYDNLQHNINNISVKPLYHIYNTYDYSDILMTKKNKTEVTTSTISMTRTYTFQKAFSEFIICYSTKPFTQISTNKNISLINYNNMYYIKKDVQDKFEAKIGIHYINHLYKRIPNFMYTYTCDQQSIYLEYIKGIEFQTWLKDFFDFEQYVFIILQIVLAIHVAQEDCQFIHFDLSPWNIILYEYKEDIEVCYQIKHTHQFIKLKTKLVPVIIDYGKSSVQNISISSISKFNPLFDILSIIIKSFNSILQNNISQDIFHKLCLMFDFFSDISPSFSNIFQLRKFIKSRSKYDNLLNINLSLCQKTTLDFFHYISQHFNTPCNTINNCILHHSTFYMFDFYLIINKQLSLSNFLHTIPKGSSPLSSLYIYNQIINNLINHNCPSFYIDKIHNYFKFIFDEDFPNVTYNQRNKHKLYYLLTSSIVNLDFKRKYLSN